MSRLTPCSTSMRLCAIDVVTRSSSTAARTLAASTSWPDGDGSPGRSRGRSRRPRAVALLVAPERARARRRSSTAASSAVGRPWRARIASHLLAQRVARSESRSAASRPARPPRRGGSARSRVAASIAWPTVWPRLSDGAAPGVALVGGDDRRACARARRRSTSSSVGRRRARSMARTRSHSAPPAISAGLQHLDEPGGELLARAASRASRGRRSPRPAGGRRRRSSSPSGRSTPVLPP